MNPFLAVPKWLIDQSSRESGKSGYSMTSSSSLTLGNKMTFDVNDIGAHDSWFDTKEKERMPFLSSRMNHEALEKSEPQQLKIRPIWNRAGSNILLTNNITFEVRKNCDVIGQNYLITNQIFSSPFERIEIKLEKQSGDNKVGLFT